MNQHPSCAGWTWAGAASAHAWRSPAGRDAKPDEIVLSNDVIPEESWFSWIKSTKIKRNKALFDAVILNHPCRRTTSFCLFQKKFLWSMSPRISKNPKLMNVWLQHRKDVQHQTSEVNPSKSLHHEQEDLNKDRDGKYESYGGVSLLRSKSVDFRYRWKPQNTFYGK